MSESIILNGSLVEGDFARQRVTSRGFAFGFGVFETIKFLDGKPCFFSEHLERLQRAIEGARLGLRLEEDVLRADLTKLLEANEVAAGVFKIVVHDDSEGAQLAMFVRTRGITEEAKPFRVIQSRVVKASQAFTSRNKTLNYMEPLLELGAARERGFDECVFCNEFGELTECSVSNLFFVKDGVLKTPDLKCGLLDGIVRAKMLEVARGAGMLVEVGRFSVDDLLEAEEAFVTNSGLGARSIASFADIGGRMATYSPKVVANLLSEYMRLERASLER